MKVFKEAQLSLNDGVATLSQNVWTKTAGANGAQTMTTDELINGVYAHADGGAAANVTTPDAADIVAVIQGCKAGTMFGFVFRNEDAGDAMTIVGGTGVTIKGTATVAAGKNSFWVGYVDDADDGDEAVSMYQVGVA